MNKGRCTQCRRSENGTTVTFIEVGTHTSYVAHIVAHIVCDGRRIARLVLRDTCFNYTYKVGTDKNNKNKTNNNSLRLYTTTYTS